MSGRWNLLAGPSGQKAAACFGGHPLGTGEWQPIETVPRDGRWILLAGPSGYEATPLRVEVCRWYPEFCPLNPLQDIYPWRNHSNNAFSDGGAAPTYWMPVPEPPK